VLFPAKGPGMKIDWRLGGKGRVRVGASLTAAWQAGAPGTARRENFVHARRLARRPLGRRGKSPHSVRVVPASSGLENYVGRSGVGLHRDPAKLLKRLNSSLGKTRRRPCLRARAAGALSFFRTRSIDHAKALRVLQLHGNAWKAHRAVRPSGWPGLGAMEQLYSYHAEKVLPTMGGCSRTRQGQRRQLNLDRLRMLLERRRWRPAHSTIDGKGAPLLRRDLPPASPRGY